MNHADIKGQLPIKAEGRLVVSVEANGQMNVKRPILYGARYITCETMWQNTILSA